jgi:hypothetical protein
MVNHFEPVKNRRVCHLVCLAEFIDLIAHFSLLLVRVQCGGISCTDRGVLAFLTGHFKRADLANGQTGKKG